MNISDMIGSVLGGMSQTNEMLRRAAQSFQTGTAEGNALQVKALDNKAAALTDQSEADVQKAQVQFQQQQLAESIQKQFNLNPDDKNNALGQYLAQAHQAREALVPVRAEYDRLSQTDLLSDPIGYIFAQLKLPSVAAKVNNLADAEDMAMERIQTDTGTMDMARKHILANTSDQLLAINLRQVQNNARMAQADLDIAKGQLLARDASTQMQVAQVYDKIGDNQRSAVSMQIQASEAAANRAERAANQRERSERLSWDRELMTEQRQLRVNKMKEDLKKQELAAGEEARINASLARIAKAMGMPVAPTIETLKTAKKETQDKWFGMATTNMFGPSIDEAVENYMSQARGNKNAIVAGGDSSTYNTAEQLYAGGMKFIDAARRAYMAEGNTKAKDEDIKKRAFDLYQESLVTSQGGSAKPSNKMRLDDPFWDTNFNPYRAKYVGMNAAIASGKDPALTAKLSTNNFFKLLETQRAAAPEKANLTGADVQAAIAAGVTLVQQGKLTAKDFAAEVADYHRLAATYNTGMDKYNLFALPAQTGYLFRISGSSYPGDNPLETDLMDPAKLENAIAKKARLRTMGSAVGKAADFMGELVGNWPPLKPVEMQIKVLTGKAAEEANKPKENK